MADRIKLDAYYTPDDVARACVATLARDLTRGTTVLEPSAGGGAFVRALMDLQVVGVMAVDVNPKAEGLSQSLASWTGDFLDYDGSPHWTVGNPPFSAAEEHARHALHISRVGVGLLLRLAFLESAKRRAFWLEHPPAEVHVLSQRPSFTGGGTDNAAYGWFVWRRGFSGTPGLYWLDRSKRQRARWAKTG